METKLWLNSKCGPRLKVTKLGVFLNTLAGINLILIFFFTFMSFGLSFYEKPGFVKEPNDENFVNNLFLFARLIPVSLFLQLKLFKFVHS
jgi:hypothetical protein